MTDQQFIELFEPLRTHFALQDGAGELPLLAHYTSILAIEKILQSNELWFSNPLFMNDLQEMRFGLNEGSRLFSNAAMLKRAGGTDERAESLQHAFSHYFKNFDDQDAFDTYVFCLSQHDKANTDGLLSMWRGYGEHGSGAALVFDAASVTIVPASPLIVAKVSYASDNDRLSQLETLLKDWADITERNALPDDKLYLAAHIAFSHIKTFALTTKHKGFSEEAEWRVIYYPERDTEGRLKQFLGYSIGHRGVEPKLKYPIGHIAGVSAEDFALEKILHSIILGPSLSSPLAKKSVERMLEKIGKPGFKSKLQTSGIPLRPNSGGSF